MGPSTGLVNRSFLYSCAKPQQSPVSGGADNATGNDKLVHALDGPRLHRLSMPRVAPIKLELMALPKPKSTSSATSCESVQTISLVASASAEKRKSKTEVASKANLRLTPENESSGESVKNSKLTLKKKYQKDGSKACKLTSKSVSSKSLDSSIKNLTISEPCNFVHVESYVKNIPKLHKDKLNPLPQKDKYSDFEDNVYAEIALRDEKEEEDQKTSTGVNSSFLWGKMAKVKDNSASSPRCREDLMDDVDDDCYDDIGSPDEVVLELTALPKPKSVSSDKPKSDQHSVSSATSCESVQTSSLMASANAEKRKSKTEVASKANLRLTPENESSGESVKNSKLTLKKKYQKHVRKAQKLKSKSVSSKSLDSSIKNLTISEPCNFVHVVSLKNGLVLNETKLNPITRKDNSEDVEDNVYAEIALRDEKEEEDQKTSTGVNSSFLWGKMAKVKDNSASSPRGREDLLDDDCYDNVGPPDGKDMYCTVPEVQAKEDPATPEIGEYDDAVPADRATPLAPEATNEDDSVYDVIGPSAYANYEELAEPGTMGTKPSEESDYEVVESKSVPPEPKEAYDDVNLPPARVAKTFAERHERINSLYASSGVAKSGGYDKESEWEDLGDLVMYDDAGVKMRSVACSHGGPSARKKLGPNRGRSRKVRRQRSRASRKGSTRSSACGKGRARPKNPGAVSVSVSLGAGSVLLLGSIDEAAKSQQQQQPGDDHGETRGLVQLRVVLLDEEVDVQETSLYVEDSSDDSNYEEVLVETFEPDNFSTDSESDFPSRSSVPIAHQYDQNGTGHLEAPDREVPPPPVHEPSLGNTLGRPIKMLRRTWSITKSLGRMRKRDQVAASNHQPLHELSDKTQPGVNELQSISLNNNHINNNNNNVELRKYFSFKKPFKKSQALTSSSTFYLDKSASAPDVLGDERPSAEEEPVYYSNDPYREAGLPDEAQPQSPPPRDDAADDQVAVDHYSVLAEEPLYQFYIESTLKAVPEPYEVASSDNDGYETVEELAPTSATTDLAKPGHRTLWQETPRVKNSALLRNRLSKAELKLQEAKFEILTSEASYLISLRVLQKEFAEDRDLRQVLGPEEESCLFDNVPGVLVASEHFLAEMEFAWDRDVMLGRLCELVVGHAERCAGVYVDYCSNQVNFDARLKELQTRKPCLEALARIQARPVCYGQRLDSFLLLPMQRITRLPLLAEAVLASLPPDHSERSSWEAALKAFQNIVVKCNEGARRVERRNEMDALVRKLEYPAKVQPVDLTDRELIRSGMVVQLLSKHDKETKLTFGRKAHKTPLHLVLLTDYLLVTKLKPNSNEDTYSVVDTCKRDQVVLESVPDNSPFAGKHALLLTLLDNHAGQRVEYVLACANNTERERWLDAVSPPKTVAEAEALYAPIKFTRVVAEHSYFPRQPDELALQPGDAIKVLRKMEDGWLFGEKLLDGQQGWFPGNFTKEIPSKHARMRNIRV